MKKILITLGFISFIFSTNAQITFEHTFDREVGWFDTNTKGLMWYQLGADTITNQFNIYNEDYSLYKVVTLPRPKGYSARIYYLSEQLFNTNSSIEFLCCYKIFNVNTHLYSSRVFVYDENATVIKDFGTYNTSIEPIIIQSTGKTKLSYYTSSTSITMDVYSLPGSIPNNVLELKTSNVKSAFPNPSKTIINLPYSLEKGQTSTMRIYKTNGHLIDQKQIDSAFDKILLNVDKYQSGTYIYEYNGVSKKFIVN